MYRVVSEWLPIDDGASDADTASLRHWNFSGWCLDCDSYFRNYINRSTPELDYYQTSQCESPFCFYRPLSNQSI